ncbi:MAG: hypothetical protein M3N25_01360 [Actinomycetota bacterium]|nr:hypothetical protein [Actinomycetota bacterium]
MIRRSHLDDTSIDQLLAGRTVPGQELLVSFVEDVHVARSAEATRPSSELATLFAEGLSTEKGELLVTAASNVTGPAPQAAGLPKWRKRNMIEIALSKLAALGLAAKIGAATGVVALSGTAAAFTGVLPAPVQERVAAVAEQVGIDIPGGKSAEHRVDAEHRPAQSDELEATEVVEEVPEVVEVPEVPQVEAPDKPAAADFGTGVSDAARSGAPQEDGRQFGEDTSNAAREQFQPADRPSGEDNPGSGYRSDAGAQQPTGTPSAEDNPGSSYRPDAGAQQPTGTPSAEDNPGSGRR